jgi:DNA-binding PadR family transcriptional regulator
LKQYLEHVSDFASIKLPTIYYHLDKMEKKGLISASQEKEGKRPEKWVYTITSDGRTAFQDMLRKVLSSSYRGEFLLDSVLYFSDFADTEHVLDALTRQMDRLEHVLQGIKLHREDVLEQQPRESLVFTKAIFRHHEYHNQAELKWLQDTVGELREYVRKTQSKTEE